MEPAAHSPFSLLPPRESRGSGSAGPAGTADLPSAVPAREKPKREGPERERPAREREDRASVLQALRAKIAHLEKPMLRAALASSTSAATATRFSLPSPASSSSSAPASQGGGWWLGCPEVDEFLPEGGLSFSGVHEIKSVGSAGASAGDWMAGLGFALRLAALRFNQLKGVGRTRAMMLWCWPQVLASEFGQLSRQGLAHMGIDPARVLIVETARQSESLAALEEGLKSGRIALAAGVFKCVDLNAARRLSLAAAARSTPCLLTTHPAEPGAAATATRWRVARAPSGPHRFDRRAPGAARFKVGLERCRQSPQSTDGASFVMEWCDEALRFGLASQLADDAACPRRTARRSR